MLNFQLKVAIADIINKRGIMIYITVITVSELKLIYILKNVLKSIIWYVRGLHILIELNYWKQKEVKTDQDFAGHIWNKVTAKYRLMLDFP